jgi:hypothetical protein
MSLCHVSTSCGQLVGDANIRLKPTVSAIFTRVVRQCPSDRRMRQSVSTARLPLCGLATAAARDSRGTPERTVADAETDAINARAAALDDGRQALVNEAVTGMVAQSLSVYETRRKALVPVTTVPRAGA